MMRETLVFLPGTLCDARVFAPQVTHFKSRYNCQVVIPQGATTMDGMAQLALDAIDAPEFSLIGFSLGGILAMAMLKLGHSRIKRLALLNTNHLKDTPERQAQRTRFVSLTRAGEFHTVLPHDIQAQFLGTRVEDKEALLNDILAMALAIGPKIYVEQMIAARDREDSTAILKSYQGKALLLCGEDDRVCPPERHYAMRALMRDAHCVTLPQTGHYSSLESPDAVNEALEKWLS